MPLKAKVITNFSGYNDEDLATPVGIIGNSLTTNAGAFATLPVSGAAILTLLGKFTDILGMPVYPNKTEDGNAARVNLEKALKLDGDNVNTTADGDEVILGLSGFPLAQPHVPVGPLAKGTFNAFTNKESNPGELDYEIKGVLHAKGYLVCYTLFTNAEADPRKWTWFWSPTSKGTLTGLDSSAKYKLRSVGLGTDPTLTFTDQIERTTQ